MLKKKSENFKSNLKNFKISISKKIQKIYFLVKKMKKKYSNTISKKFQKISKVVLKNSKFYF